MTLLGHFNSKEHVKLRGKIVHIPRPPNEFAERDYLQHKPSESFVPKSKASAEKSATNFIVTAKRTPVPPFMHSEKTLVPPQDPYLSPSRTTMRLDSPRWTCPPVRNPNTMQFSPIVAAEEAFFERSSGPEGVAHLKKSSSGRRSPRDPCVPAINALSVSSNSRDSLLNQHECLPLTVHAQRSPRFANTKFYSNSEGVLTMHPISAQKELVALSRVPPIQSPRSYDTRVSAQDRHFQMLQSEFERTFLSPRSVTMDLGMHDLKLHSRSV